MNSLVLLGTLAASFLINSMDHRSLDRYYCHHSPSCQTGYKPVIFTLSSDFVNHSGYFSELKSKKPNEGTKEKPFILERLPGLSWLQSEQIINPALLFSFFEAYVAALNTPQEEIKFKKLLHACINDFTDKKWQKGMLAMFNELGLGSRIVRIRSFRLGSIDYLYKKIDDKGQIGGYFCTILRSNEHYEEMRERIRGKLGYVQATLQERSHTALIELPRSICDDITARECCEIIDVEMSNIRDNFFFNDSKFFWDDKYPPRSLRNTIHLLMLGVELHITDLALRTATPFSEKIIDESKRISKINNRIYRPFLGSTLPLEEKALLMKFYQAHGIDLKKIVLQQLQKNILAKDLAFYRFPKTPQQLLEEAHRKFYQYQIEKTFFNESADDT